MMNLVWITGGRKNKIAGLNVFFFDFLTVDKLINGNTGNTNASFYKKMSSKRRTIKSFDTIKCET